MECAHLRRVLSHSATPLHTVLLTTPHRTTTPITHHTTSPHTVAYWRDGLSPSARVRTYKSLLRVANAEYAHEYALAESRQRAVEEHRSALVDRRMVQSDSMTHFATLSVFLDALAEDAEVRSAVMYVRRGALGVE